MNSSGIVSLVAKISQAIINNFTLEFFYKRDDESALTRSVALKFNTIYNEETLHANSFKNFLNKLVFHFDDPFRDASSMPVF